MIDLRHILASQAQLSGLAGQLKKLDFSHPWVCGEQDEDRA